MKHHIKKWSFHLLKLVVVCLALAYIAWKVDWENGATLAANKQKVTVLAWKPGETEIQIDKDGTPTWLPASAFLRPPTSVKGQALPIVVPGLKTVIKAINWNWIYAALAVFSCNYIFLAWRLRLLLQTQDVNLRRRDAVKVSYASAFLNFAIPTGTTGGDVYKAYYVSAHATGRRTEAITIVLLDRVIGLINFIFMAAIVSGLSYMSGRVGALGSFIAMAFIISIVASCMYFSGRVRDLVGIDRWLPKLPLGHQLVRIDQTAYSLKNHPFLLANCFFWTIVVQSVVCIAGMFMAKAVGMKCDLTSYSHWLDYFLAIIVGLTVASLPGNPPQGFGVLEGIIASVLVTNRGYGDFNHVFAVCMGIRLLHLLWALPGAIVLLIEPKPKPPEADPPPTVPEAHAQSPAASASVVAIN